MDLEAWVIELMNKRLKNTGSHQRGMVYILSIALDGLMDVMKVLLIGLS